MTKYDIDKLHKDKKHKRCSRDFSVSIEFAGVTTAVASSNAGLQHIEETMKFGAAGVPNKTEIEMAEMQAKVIDMTVATPEDCPLLDNSIIMSRPLITSISLSNRGRRRPHRRRVQMRRGLLN